MKEKNLIEEIRRENSDYKHASQAENLANSLETISDDIYSESERFIYELMQNADDARNEEQEELETVIEFTNNFIVISHNGRAFSEKDIKAISSIGKSQKSENPDQTGYKGIGFKSVFGKSNCVYISSGNYCFRYDKSCWKKCPHKMPWQIIPVPSYEEIPPELKTIGFLKHPVSTAIKFDQKNELNHLKLAVNKLFNDSQIMLFLRKITKIRIVTDREYIFHKTKQVISKKSFAKMESFVLTEVHLRNNIKISKWIVGDFSGIELDHATQGALNRDEKAPKRLKEAQYTNISFAGRISDKNELTEIKDDSLIFTYLPTKINKRFPFLVNADFLTNAPREGFHEDRAWNIWLFEQVARKTFEWLRELTSTRYRYQVIRLIPDRFKFSPNLMEKAFNKGYDQAIKEVEFIPNKENNLLSVPNTLIEDTDIDRVIEVSILIDYWNCSNGTNFSSKSIANKNLKSLSELKRKLGVQTFRVQDLKDFLSSSQLQGNLDAIDGVNIIKFFHQKVTEEKRSDLWGRYITGIPFILNQEKELCASNKPIYLPVDNFETFEIDELSQSFNFIHNEVFEKIGKPQRDWLSKIGIAEPTPKSIIEKTISQNPEDLTNNEENSIEIVRYLFKHQ